MTNKIKSGLIVSSILLPAVTFAEYFKNTSTISESVFDIVSNYLIPIVFSLALLYFFWGVAKYIRSAGAEKEEGRMIMVWGVVALFVMASVWGLVRFLQREFTLDGVDTPIQVPKPIRQ
jgi:hypothetical protein